MRRAVPFLILLAVLSSNGCALADQNSQQGFRCPVPFRFEKISVDESRLAAAIAERWRTLRGLFHYEGDFAAFFGHSPRNHALPHTLAIDEAAATQLGIKPEVMMNILEKFPATWRQNINSIIFQNSEGQVFGGYGFPLGPVIGAACYLPNGKADLYFFKAEWTDREVEKLVAHEIAHPNDWKALHRSFEERVNMAYEVLKRIESTDRFTGLSPVYAENFHRMPLIRKMTEYWAEIVRFYFTKRDELPEEDKKLVEKYLN